MRFKILRAVLSSLRLQNDRFNCPRARPANETGSTARGNIFGVNLSARILQGRWEICHCTQAYAGTWNFMRCSVSINPSLQRALRPRFVLGACQADIYVPTHVHMYLLLSCSLFDNIDSGILPPVLPCKIQLSRLKSTWFFSTLCRTHDIIFAITWHSSRILSTADQRMRPLEYIKITYNQYLRSNCTVSIFFLYFCTFLFMMYCEL